ncbi:MAG: transcriptional repressor LexA [Verrucomicrobiota bacterium]|nr:transcriptional repressor LexA [Verrucomicrobiota bacterium]
MLTDRQQQVLKFIQVNTRENGYPPSTREIQQHFGFSSQTTVMDHLRALESKGELKRAPGKARGCRFVRAVETVESMLSIPLYGEIPAGNPQGREQESEGFVSIDLASIGLPSNPHRSFALKVKGESMINAHIMEGDIAIFEFRNPMPGDIVAALIDGETTLKRYIVENKKPYLKAENPRFKNLIPAQELVIQGVMISLVRTARPSPPSAKNSA